MYVCVYVCMCSVVYIMCRVYGCEPTACMCVCGLYVCICGLYVCICGLYVCICVLWYVFCGMCGMCSVVMCGMCSVVMCSVVATEVRTPAMRTCTLL